MNETTMKTVCIQAYPYASQAGKMEIPKGMTPEEENAYISTHWHKFVPSGKPDLDYCGTDFEYFEDFEDDD